MRIGELYNEIYFFARYHEADLVTITFQNQEMTVVISSKKEGWEWKTTITQKSSNFNVPTRRWHDELRAFKAGLKQKALKEPKTEKKVS